jgi:hypothetical protein
MQLVLTHFRWLRMLVQSFCASLRTASVASKALRVVYIHVKDVRCCISILRPWCESGLMPSSGGEYISLVS